MVGVLSLKANKSVVSSVCGSKRTEAFAESFNSKTRAKTR